MQGTWETFTILIFLKNVTNGITFGIRGLLHTPLPPPIHLKISWKSKKIFSVEILHFWMTLLMWV